MIAHNNGPGSNPHAELSPPVTSANWPSPILMLSPTLARTGGIEAHISELITEMEAADIPVYAAVNSVARGAPAPKNVRVIPPLQIEDAHAALPEVEQLIADIAPQVIHVHHIQDQQFLSRLRRYAPVVQSVHNYFTCSSSGARYFQPGRECHRPHASACLANALLRNCGHRRVPMVSVSRYLRISALIEGLREADAVVAYSKYVTKDLRNNGVPHAIPLRYFVRDRPSTRQGSADARKVLFAGRIVPDKGLDVLLRALVHVDATLEVWGDGWAMEACRRLSTKLQLTDRVRFAGWASETELHDAYERCAVVAVPSVWPEPFGLVGLEAMVRSKAVVASDTGGIGDWLAHQVNGYLVRPGDPHALALGLEHVLADPAQRLEMGRRGREIALTEFSVEQHLESLRSVYVGAIERWRLSRTRLTS